MEQIVFENAVIQRSSLYRKCAGTLQELSQRDYSDKYEFNPNIECLDLDVYEKNTRKGNLNRTMDAVIGICDCSTKKHKSNERLLLVELRMGYRNVNNLSVTDLVNKVSHSKIILGTEIPIDKNNIFIFDDKVYPQAVRWFSSRGNARGELKYYLVHSVTTFRSYIANYDDLPYVPQTNAESIKKDVESSANLEDFQGVLRKINYWLNVAKKQKYINVNEFRHIMVVIEEMWMVYAHKIRNSNDTNLQIEAEIFEEDFNTIRL